MKNNNKAHIIIDFIIAIMLIIGIYFTYKFYSNNNLNQFIMSEKNLYTSNFSKDTKVKYGENNSYKILSPEYNDAMFYKTISVEKNTPYKVTCMVKTSDVQSENNLLGSGAQISVEDTTERSVAISGTADWQQIEMIFNSKDREEINIGFRLGGYIDNCKGEAWFSDFKIEKGTVEEETTDWKFACFIFDNVNATTNGKTINYKMTTDDVTDMRDTIGRFEIACSEMSKGKMTATCDTYKINEPITTLSYDEEYGYFVAPEDIEAQIKSTINTNDYDHIFIIFKLDSEEVKDWIGLGAMDYYGVGFSNIRIPNDENSYIYRYNKRINLFPEEVLMHEFLHSLERTLKEYGYNIPALHDYEKYGYKNEILYGQKKWYTDYMNCEIETNTEKIGLDPIVYMLKPAKKSNFVNSQEISNAFDEPQNIKEEIVQIIENIGIRINQILEQI